MATKSDIQLAGYLSRVGLWGKCRTFCVEVKVWAIIPTNCSLIVSETTEEVRYKVERGSMPENCAEE
jgi:hypothetical protein